MAKKRAFSYIRMSTDAQLQGNSLQRQLELTRAYAKKMGFELIEDLRDIGLSAHDGTNIKKGKLGEFIKAVESGEIDNNNSVLLVESLDRLSRKNPMQAFHQFANIIEHGIEIHTIFDGQIYTSETLTKNQGLLFISMGQMQRAYFESEEKSKRLKKRWQNNRDGIDKKILTSVCPAWLKANATKTGFDEISDRVKTIRSIFDLYLEEGMGAFAIANHLNNHPDKFPRFTNPTKKNRAEKGKHKTGWHKSYVTKILNNPAVYGEFQPHELTNGLRKPSGVIISNYFPEVISKERYILAQAKMKGRRLTGGGRKGTSFNNLFTKLVFCGHCGGPVHYLDKGTKPKGGRYLRCSNAVANYGCSTKSWRYEELEYNFFGYVSDVEFGAALQKGGDKSKRQNLRESQQLYKEELKNKKKHLNALLDFEGGLSETAITTVRQKINTISNDIDKLNDRLKNIALELEEINVRSSQKIHEDVITAVREIQNSASTEERVAIRRILHNQICAVVERIELDGLGPNDEKEYRCYTVFFKNGRQQTVFPYSVDDSDGAELRDVVQNPKTGKLVVSGVSEKIDTTSFKILGKANMDELKKGKIEIKKIVK
jgi:DNA invertase Pin-like site-specific DNA recombinase